MNLPHEYIGRDLVELNVLDEVAYGLLEGNVGVVITVLLAPHESSLERKVHKKITSGTLDRTTSQNGFRARKCSNIRTSNDLSNKIRGKSTKHFALDVRYDSIPTYPFFLLME